MAGVIKEVVPLLPPFIFKEHLSCLGDHVQC